MNKPRNTYQSISLLYCVERPEYSGARIYTAVENVGLDMHLEVDYKQGKREMARLMLRLGELPKARRSKGALYTYVFYDLHGFLD